MKTAPLSRLADWLIIGAFVGGLALPLILWLALPAKDFSMVEKRRLALAPPFPASLDAALGYVGLFDDYFQDHFGLREWLIYRYQLEIDNRFGQSGAVTVVTGDEGWLYFAGENVLEDFLGQARLSPQALARGFADLDGRHQWLAERGIAYLFVVAPNKQTIYPEYHPLRSLAKPGETMLKQVAAGLGAARGAWFVDLAPALLAAKERGNLYYKTDTHWNARGFTIAGIETLERVQALVPAITPHEAYVCGNQTAPRHQAGDLAGMIGKGLEREMVPVLEPRDPKSVLGWSPDWQLARSLPPWVNKPKFAETMHAAGRAVVFHDSFFVFLRPMLAESFFQVLYLWQDYDQATMEAILESFQPDVVIEELVERHLDLLFREPGAQ